MRKIDDRLEDATRREKHAFGAMHHPIYSLGSKWLDKMWLKNGTELPDVVVRHNVKAMAFGHAHQEHDSEFKGVKITGTPSTSSQFQPKSDGFKMGEESPGYHVIWLFPDGKVEGRVVVRESVATARGTTAGSESFQSDGLLSNSR